MFYVFVVSALVSLHSQASSILKYNRLNFFEWYEQAQFHLGVLDLDLTLITDKLVAITNSSSTKQMSFHKAWKISNRLSLMFMRITIVNNIKLAP